MILTELYKIDGAAMVAPDANVNMSFSDLDAAQSGRDQSGYMHRSPVRKKVGVWEFTYSYLTQQEYAYLLSLLPEGGTFRFTRPSQTDWKTPQTSKCYLSNYSIGFISADTGDYRDLKFSIIEC